MQLLPNIRLALWALTITATTAIPDPQQQQQSASTQLDTRYVPDMAPGSSPKTNTNDENDDEMAPNQDTLPGVNHMPVNSTLNDAHGAVAAWAATSKDVPVDAVFGQKCRHLALLGYGEKGQSVLQAACLDGSEGTWWLTSLNLNKCLGNRKGKLVFMPEGNYDDTCRPCGIDTDKADSKVVLRCSCLPKAGGVPRFTELSLADHGMATPLNGKRLATNMDVGYWGVRALDGRLVCGHYEGTKSPQFNTTSGNGGNI